MTITDLRGDAQVPTGKGDEPPAVSSAPVLAASWERSQKYGLRRDDRVLFNNVVSFQTARRIEQENGSLLQHARPEMARLYEGLHSARWLVLCVNALGEIVCSVGNRSSAPRELQVLMQPGRIIAEAELGTTAPGCALAECRPSVVARGEHYLNELESFFCASAPIIGPTGTLAGALDVSGIDVASLPLAADMVSFAVRRIENSLLSSMDNCVVLRFHVDERLLSTPFEGMIALSQDGMVCGLNRTACQLFSVPSQDAVGLSADLLFDRGLDGILRRTFSAGSQPVRVGGRFGTFSCVASHPARRGRSASNISSRPAPRRERNLVIKDQNLSANWQKAERVLRHGLPIMLAGESGVGKELIARALHEAVRPDSPFIAINCAAIPESLIEAELFGYVDGAFTGGRKGGAAGKIEQAHEGVLFLDEIGDMPASLQTRLLRVLQERSVMRIGDSRENPVDMLVICATHRDIEKLIKSNLFREDLYYRLNGFVLRIPPLRERTDIVAIIEALFTRWLAQDAGGKPILLDQLLTSEAVRCLARHSWPGNVRELEHTIRTLIALRTNDEPIDAHDLPAHICTSSNVSDERVAPHGGEADLLEATQIETVRKAVESTAETFRRPPEHWGFHAARCTANSLVPSEVD